MWKVESGHREYPAELHHWGSMAHIQCQRADDEASSTVYFYELIYWSGNFSGMELSCELVAGRLREERSEGPIKCCHMELFEHIGSNRQCLQWWFDLICVRHVVNIPDMFRQSTSSHVSLGANVTRISADVIEDLPRLTGRYCTPLSAHHPRISLPCPRSWLNGHAS